MSTSSLFTRTAARSPWRRVLRMTLIAVAIYGGVLLLLYWKQEFLLFAPTRLPPGHRFSVPDVVERTIDVDGATLSALHFRQPGAKGVVFFLHGNAGSLEQWLTGTDFYRRTGFDLFMLDYRGYGKSTGRITSEAQLHADVRAAWQAIAPEYAGRKVVLYGRSLGSGLATRLATEVDADLLVLVSPYSSLRDVARDHYPWVPGALLRYPMRTDEWLPHVRMPVLILHGDRDRIIGVEHAERLRALHPAAELVRLRGVDHNDIDLSQEYQRNLAGRYRSL
ncbi:MAG TPA: alpha/beta fold hydrolase [Burkholderiaceae bacterium]|nr:alpha/beta fold hydrolase [Burkholderiaceae bacterium]